MAIFSVCLGLLALTGQPSKPIDLQPLKNRLDTVCQRFQGRMGYSLKLLKTGQAISFRGDERFPTASTIKTAIMVEAVNRIDEGSLKWTDQREVPPIAERTENMASMWAYFLKDGVKINVDGWVNLMIGVSDNTATKVLGLWLGHSGINGRMEKLGLPNTKFLGYAPATDATLRRLNSQFGLGMTTPNEMARLLELIATNKAASPAGCDRMLRVLSRQYWDDAISGQVPPTVRVANKTGAISRSRSDSAIVYGPTPYILTIYTDNQKDRRWAPDNEGDLALAKVGQIVWNALNPGMPYRPPQGSERFAPSGGGVD